MGWLPDDKWERREVVIIAMAVGLCLALLTLGAWLHLALTPIGK